jgi:hypothetical protein
MAFPTYSHGLKRYIHFSDLAATHAPDHWDHGDHRRNHQYDVRRYSHSDDNRRDKDVIVFKSISRESRDYDHVIHKAGCGGGFGSGLGHGGVTFSPVGVGFGAGFGVGLGVPTLGIGLPTLGVPAFAPPAFAVAPPTYAVAPPTYAVAPPTYAVAPPTYAAPAPITSYATTVPPAPSFAVSTPPPTSSIYTSPTNVVNLAPDIVKGPDTVYLKPPSVSVPGNTYEVNETNGNTGQSYSVAQPLQMSSQSSYSFNTQPAMQTQMQPQQQQFSAFTTTAMPQAQYQPQPQQFAVTSARAC